MTPGHGAPPSGAPRPGPAPAACERYLLRGGGALVLRLGPEDELVVVDLEGRQPCRLAVFVPDADAPPLPSGDRAGPLLAAVDPLPGEPGEDAGAILAALRDRGLPGAIGSVVHLFTGGSCAGEEARFRAGGEAAYLLHAPGGTMAVDAQDPPTDLLVLVHRARPPSSPPLPPPPLATPREELRIDRASARAYRVRAGECIQVIDVAGRQRAEFVAFDARRLEQGVERGLDAAATRALAGRRRPGTGLWPVFYDQDLQPLVEVVHDTVGRHDAFALACTARDYEAAGHPNHPSCAAGLNAALAPCGVAPRSGWAAVNLFSNTQVDRAGRVHVGEPWSRPGDYVLLRAMTDLVCATAACADDIGPTNGGAPSDIHVRIYPEGRAFSRAVAFRTTPDADPELTRESAFHPRTAALADGFVAHGGFWLPAAFRGRGVLDEVRACRAAAAVADLSALRKVEVLGPDAEALMQLATTRDVRRLAAGGAVRAVLCHEHGGLVDDGVLFRLGAQGFRWVGAAAGAGSWLRGLAAARGLTAWVKSSTDQLHNLLVHGPRSRDIVADVVWTPPGRPSVGALAPDAFTVGRVGDLQGAPVLASRTARWGESGYELFCHPRDAGALWDAVWAAGAPRGLAPMGLEALDVLRIEAGLAVAPRDFDDTVDPYEAGLDAALADAKDDEFVGRAALERRRAHPRRRLVGLAVDGDEAPAHGAGVHAGIARVGVVTSAARSPLMGGPIALAVLDVACAAPGTAVEVATFDGRRRLPAMVTPLPFHHPRTDDPPQP